MALPMMRFGILCVVVGVSAGCGGKKKEAEVPGALPAGTRSAELSRCQADGRDDRDVQESSAPGAVAANVRRVYGYIGTGIDRRKILLCREVDTNLDGIKDMVRTYGDLGEKLNEQADADYDGRIDTWITFVGSRPGRIEFDKNGDGKPDESRYYADGKILRVQQDTNADGKPDSFEIYKDGRLDRRGVDVDHDGQVDRWDRDELWAKEEEVRERAAEKAREGAGAEAGEGSPSSEETSSPSEN